MMEKPKWKGRKEGGRKGDAGGEHGASRDMGENTLGRKKEREIGGEKNERDVRTRRHERTARRPRNTHEAAISAFLYIRCMRN